MSYELLGPVTSHHATLQNAQVNCMLDNRLRIGMMPPVFLNLHDIGGCKHPLVCMVDIFNIFINKHMQILMFMFPNKFFFHTPDIKSHFSLTFISRTMGYKGTVLFALFIYCKQENWLCRVWAILMEHPKCVRVYILTHTYCYSFHCIHRKMKTSEQK